MTRSTKAAITWIPFIYHLCGNNCLCRCKTCRCKEHAQLVWLWAWHLPWWQEDTVDTGPLSLTRALQASMGITSHQATRGWHLMIRLGYLVVLNNYKICSVKLLIRNLFCKVEKWCRYLDRCTCVGECDAVSQNPSTFWPFARSIDVSTLVSQKHFVHYFAEVHSAKARDSQTRMAIQLATRGYVMYGIIVCSIARFPIPHSYLE